MATHLAIASTCEAIIRLLRVNHDPNMFSGASADFQVYVAEDFQHPMDTGVSLFLYRIYHNSTTRSTTGRVLSNGRQQRPQLTVDLHFMLTAWAKRASLQHEIAGWMVRVMEDFPLLTPGLLNAYQADVFQPDEQVEVGVTTLSVEDMFHVWDVMIEHTYQLSMPYVARMVQIESFLTKPVSGVVQERVGEYRQLEPIGIR